MNKLSRFLSALSLTLVASNCLAGATLQQCLDAVNSTSAATSNTCVFSITADPNPNDDICGNIVANCRASGKSLDTTKDSPTMVNFMCKKGMTLNEVKRLTYNPSSQALSGEGCGRL